MANRADGFTVTPEQLQQHPVALLLLTLMMGLMIAIALGSLIMAVVASVRIAQGKPLLRVEPWTPRVWGLIDLILVAVLLVVAQRFSLDIWAQLTHFDLKQLKQEGDFPLSAMAVGSLSYLITMGLAIGWLVLRYGVPISHIGFTFQKFRGNIAIGFCATLLSLPVVYLVMALVSTGFNEEYEHPLLDRMLEDATPAAFLLGMFCAVIAAPISEEFLFRVLLQGWLQSIPFSGKHFWWLTGASQRERTMAESDDAALGVGAGGNTAETLAPEPPSNPYSPPIPLATVVSGDVVATTGVLDGHSNELVAASGTGQPTVPQPTANEPVGGTFAASPPIWPVFVSGTLFGLAHWGYGLSFAPLILLGIILGFLYRATHSIWPGFVVHFILNLIAITSLGIVTYVKAVVQ